MKPAKVKYRILFLVLLFSTLNGFGQFVEAIEAKGDLFLENGQYQKAIDIYKAALVKNPNLVRVQYRLGESYRLMLEFDSAENYYQSVAVTKNPNFPLAGFYLGQMQKRKGKYAEAIRTFKASDEFLIQLNLHENNSHRYYYKQAKIEIDGCQLAMNQVTLVQEDYSFEALAAPLNSEFSDYAAFSMGSDSVLCLTSARKGGKGSVVDNQFGEFNTDLFRFEKESNGWSEYEPGDRFESEINTKYNDGSGSFNKDRTKFYYTNCHDDLDGVCHIYMSSKINGRWTESVPLNSNINEAGFDSKHPNLTMGGDTLFYATDKEGGLGGSDLWMSINAGGDNWGPSINLGDNINTPFEEASPFYSEQEKVLFFSSDGHRGFGGRDIYIAKGRNFEVAEIHNAGMPFNSNSDDIFFFLGDDRGYLSSNREGGLGNFDIYSFNIKSKEDIISAVSTEETIAGRNSLFTEDYNFDSKEPEIINQIISRMLSSSFSEVELLLTDEQLAVYNSLSQDDKDRIDKIVKARLRKMTNSMLRSVRSEDDFYYQELDTDKRLQVDKVVVSHIEQRSIGRSVFLSSESTTFYNSVDTEEREKLDILLTERVRSADNYHALTPSYSALGDEDQKEIDALAKLYLEQKKGWQSAVLKVDQRDFWRTNEAGNSYKINAAIRERLLTLDQEKEYQITEADRDFYEELSLPFKQSLRTLAGTYLMSDFDTFEEVLNKEDLEMYGEFSDSKKKSLDRLLLRNMANMADADMYRAETAFGKDKLQISQSANPDDSFRALKQANPNLSDEATLSLQRFIRSSYDSYMMSEESIYEEALPIEEIVAKSDDNIDPLGNANEPAYQISQDALAAYAVLSASKRKVIDKLIGLKYVNKVYEDGELEGRDASAHRSMEPIVKQHIEMLTRGVRGDELSSAEGSMLSEAYSYYSAQSKVKKALINRIVLARSFNGVSGNFLLNQEDSKVNAELTLEDRELLEEVRLFRFSTEVILTEDMAVEAKDVDEVPVNAIALVHETTTEIKDDVPEVLARADEINATSGKVILDIPSQDISRYTDLLISGRLVGGSNGSPLSEHPISLREHDREKTTIDEFTDSEGNFAFYVPVDDYHFLTERIAGDSNVKIVNLIVEGRHVTSEKKYANRMYFDLGSSTLRREAKKMLDEVVRVYKQNPMRIVIESHTDSRGQEESNLALSKSRGVSALNYLVSGGVTKSDISDIWHGEGKPIAANTNPFGRQLNRGLDIRLISDKEIRINLGEVYLVRPDVTIEELAASFKLTVDQIKQENALTNQKLRDYQPVIIKNAKGSADFNLVAPTKLKDLSNFVYRVLPGENIEDIAIKFNVPEELLMDMNKLRPSGFTAGKEIKIYQ